MKDPIKPVVKAGRTKAAVKTQGYTYNQSGLTYNEIGVMYGGIFEHDIFPMITSSKKDKLTQIIRTLTPQMVVGRTHAQIFNQGYTYNEAGFTYNQLGIMYGGLYEHDIYPIIAKASKIKAHILFGSDFGAIVIPKPSGRRGQLIGMLGLTYAR